MKPPFGRWGAFFGSELSHPCFYNEEEICIWFFRLVLVVFGVLGA